MDEELRKRNTDCVYFLASPLTCKKGLECEYRHNEIARLNQRDCRFWFAGGCLNPTCAFRHPPLEGSPKKPSEPDLKQSAVHVNKIGIACHFFYNGFCNQGEKCLYLHGPDVNLPTSKYLRMRSVNTDGHHEKKASMGSVIGPTPIDRHANSFDMGPKGAPRVKNETGLDIQQAAPNKVTKQNASPKMSGSPYKDAAAGRSNSPLATAGSIKRRFYVSTGKSSDDAMEVDVERDEWLESSPGFDDVVDGSAIDLDYEDDPEYSLHHDVEDRECNRQNVRCDCEEIAKTIHAYRSDNYNHLSAELTPGSVREFPAHSKESALDHIWPLKGRFFPSKLVSNGQCSMDLRDLIERRKMNGGHSQNHSLRRLVSSHPSCQSRKRLHSPDEQWLHGRRASKLRISSGSYRIRNEDERPGLYFRDRSRRYSQQLLSELSGRTASRNQSYNENFTTFTGPKTLAQIKEEIKDKRRSLCENWRVRRKRARVLKSLTECSQK